MDWLRTRSMSALRVKAAYKPLSGTDDPVASEPVAENADNLQRRLHNRQIQLIAIGASIGTALFVSIGSALREAGPASLLIAYVIYSCLVGLVNNCMAEMAIAFPVSGGFIRQAGEWVDDAFGFMAGWNFFFYEALLIPFEITALDLVLRFWTDAIPAAVVYTVAIVAYAIINVMAVKSYGEAEFWLSSGKVFLIVILFCFTFSVMVGGNPEHEAYGFRYWNDPGAFAPYLAEGDTGRFEGFLAALWSASFTIVGPEYLSIISAEAKRPRADMGTAFKTIYWRFGIFFIGSALAVGILVPYNDPTLTAIFSGSGTESSAAASPYVIAMHNLGIRVLPDIVNALLITSILSAGNTYTYCAIRSLYGLALNGHAPKVFRTCTKSGIPIYCFGVTMLFPFLSYLGLSHGSSQVLTWIVDIVTAGGLVDYIVICTTYIFFYRATKAQGVDRASLPYKGWWQPQSGWIGLVAISLIVLFHGYKVFLPGQWHTIDFFTSYGMAIIAPVLFVGWKFAKRTKVVKASEADLVWEKPIIDQYEATLEGESPGFWTEMVEMLRLRRADDPADEK